jgi:hypothetical protein
VTAIDVKQRMRLDDPTRGRLRSMLVLTLPHGGKIR